MVVWRRMYIPVGYTRSGPLARLFRSNRSQAVRIPKGLEFPASVSDVDIIEHGVVRILVPKKLSMRDWIKFGPRLSEDFNADIEDLPPDDRDFQWD